ncbi:MAG TPA: hypothetical protein PKJ41_10565, partial [Bryobacteraceae bacterium]|nr:hypothetical protein [Bryobacteraceae bacterium]
MPEGYLPLFIFLPVAVAFPIVLLLVFQMLRPAVPGGAKEEAYECGIKAASNARGRYGALLPSRHP